MNLEKLVVVSGIPGIHRVAANRNNGLIIEDLDSGKKRFASSRKHQFTPLESIAIYTTMDSKELKHVFQSMLDQFEDNPPINPSKSKAEDIKEYFTDILPDYDPDQVHLSDMKKVIKWFTFLKERDLLKEEETPKVEEKEAAKKETKKETPKVEGKAE